MSPRLRRLSGEEAVRIFNKLGFEVASRRGSHVKLLRVTADRQRQALTIPDHKELDLGTIQAIVRQAGRFVDPQVLREHFYTP